MVQLLVFAVIFSLPLSLSQADSCTAWFNSSHWDKKENCRDNCETFLISHPDKIDCAAQCKQLCNGTYKDTTTDTTKGLFGSLIFYPGLTDAEKKLIAENPSDSLKVFLAKNSAEEEAQSLFPKSRTNDESDAFRHFVWAGLLVKSVGTEKAQVYLDAHETNPDQPASEKAMDLANNRMGILEAQKLQSKENLNLRSLEQSAIKSLKEKKLSVLEPRGFIPSEPK